MGQAEGVIVFLKKKKRHACLNIEVLYKYVTKEKKN